MHILDQMMRSVIRIEATSITGSISTGTGFAYRFACQENGSHVPALITNKHVIECAFSISLPVSVADEHDTPLGYYEVVTYHLNSSNVVNHPNPDIDLCAVILTPIYNHFINNKRRPALCTLDKTNIADHHLFSKLLPLEDVTMVGFPNGIWDSTNNGAIARRGVIATTPSDNYLGAEQFVIDMACFPGSSGSPVFLTNFGSYSDRNGGLIVGTRFKLLGVLYAGPQHTASGEIVLAPVPTSNKPMSITSMPNNLGYVIKSTQFEELEKIITANLNSEIRK